jgi:hypothetical protein
MKTDMIRLRIAILLVCALLFASESHSASLRQINRMIKRKEYASAMAALEKELPELRNRPAFLRKTAVPLRRMLRINIFEGPRLETDR